MEFSREQIIRQLSDLKENGQIKVIAGSRSIGKSYLLNELYYRYLISSGISTGRIIRFSFSSEEDLRRLGPKARTKDKRTGYRIDYKSFLSYLGSFLNNEDTFYIFLDEIDYLDNISETMKLCQEHANLDLYVTTSFRDTVNQLENYSLIHVLPLTFSEYAEGTKKDVYEAWSEYIVTGGLPAVAVLLTQEERIQYLRNLIEEMCMKDIIQRNGVRKKTSLSGMLMTLSSLLSKPIHPARIQQEFHRLGYGSITPETVVRFLTLSENAFFIQSVKGLDIKKKKEIHSPFKVYFEDIGIRNACLNFTQIDEASLLENIVYNELLHRGYNVTFGALNVTEDTGRKDKNNHAIYAPKTLEVDFIAEKENQKCYVQSSFHADREKKTLARIRDAFPKLVVTKRRSKISRDEQGIVTMDRLEFLINENASKS
jgi:predicted AAA+ superfamily ATPase